MKKIIIIFMLCSMVGTAAAQQEHVTNIRVQQSQEQLFVQYDLSVRADIKF